WLVFQTGVSEMRSYVGQAPAGTVAAALNVSAGERVVRLDGRAIDVWSEFRLTLVDAALAGHPVKLETVTAEGTPVERMIEFGRGVADHLDGDLAGYLGFVPYAPPLRPVVGSIVDGSAAQAGGLKVGDTVAEIDGTAIAWWSQVVDCVKASPGKSLTVTIARDGQRKVLHIVPAGVEQGGIRIGRIGAGVRLDPSVDNRFRVEVRYGAVDALGRSLQQTWDMARLTLVVMARMVTGEVSIRNISGPVAIADYAGQSARIGPSAFARFLALVSVSLGVLNLLPIPILDGGHLMYYLAEFFKGSPLAERTLEIGQRIGIALLGLLMALALYNDFNRLISG
ncbi:MAG TPA: RIP metalloprotease RseP, partial [Accumulibacter sp.]|nr:RIP metalloprotease RseP [Accumulibacter sp.]